MASGAKYFILNRESDWKDIGLTKNIEFENDKLVFKSSDGENAVFISKPLDSLQDGTVWHRLRINLDMPNNSSYKLKIYSSDTSKISLPSSEKKSLNDLNSYLFEPSIDINRKIDIFDSIGAKTYENPRDLLLYNFKGRYLWFCIEMINYSNQPIIIDSLKIEFPQVTFVDYLPEIYRKEEKDDSFLARFVGIFQSMYVDLEDKVDYVALNFDADRTTKDFLNWIASWLSIKDAAIWGEKRLRNLIKEAVKIYKMKGTKRAVAKIVEEYAGIDPIIVEQFDVKGNMYYDSNKHTVENLFGENGYVFTVMIPQAHVRDTESYVELLKVINTVKPIDSICNLVVLNDQIHLDNHCYMGINSFITKNEELVLNKSQRDINNLVISETP